MYIKKVTVLECSNNISCLTYPQGQLWPDMASFGLVPSTTFVVKNANLSDPGSAIKDLAVYQVG